MDGYQSGMSNLSVGHSEDLRQTLARCASYSFG
jgi:hypothetical protein